MTRSRRSAKAAGAYFERQIADWLAARWSKFIDRRVKTGAKDKGDISNFYVGDRKVVIEAKDYGGVFHVGTWLSEAETERLNDDAVAGIVIAKRRGTTDPAKQVVFMTVLDFVVLLTLAGGRGSDKGSE